MVVDTLNISEDEGGQINQYGHKAGELIGELKTAGDDEFRMPFRNPVDMVSGLLQSILLWGKYDFVVPPQLGYDAEKLIGTTDKELVMYEFSDHSPMNGEGMAYAADILRFINDHLK